MDKLCRGYSSESLRIQVSDAIERWECYGCSADVLAAITVQILGLATL